MHVLGFDIGGANTKTALVEVCPDDRYQVLRLNSIPFNFRSHASNLDADLSALVRDQVDAAHENDLRLIGLTLTAESVGIFHTLAEGVTRVLSAAGEGSRGLPVRVVDVAGKMLPLAAAYTTPIGVASANWAATATLVGPLVGTGLLVDAGSTTTDIIPIRAGRLASLGHTDLERLMTGELVYTGMLRTYLQSLVQRVPIGEGRFVRIASELRCLSADIHVLLGHIPEQHMPHPYSGKMMGITHEQALDNLARVLCSDTTQLTTAQLLVIAQAIYQEQVRHIADAISEVLVAQRFVPDEIRAAVVGIGRQHLAIPALAQAGVSHIVPLPDSDEASDIAPAMAVAVLAGRMAQREEYSDA